MAIQEFQILCEKKEIWSIVHIEISRRIAGCSANYLRLMKFILYLYLILNDKSI
jgi:hypothetical protein